MPKRDGDQAQRAHPAPIDVADHGGAESVRHDAEAAHGGEFTLADASIHCRVDARHDARDLSEAVLPRWARRLVRDNEYCWREVASQIGEDDDRSLVTVEDRHVVYDEEKWIAYCLRTELLGSQIGPAACECAPHVDGASNPQGRRASSPGASVVGVMEQLRRVAESGPPAQQAEARRLLVVLRERPGDMEALETAGRLVEAYLHDPYLERG